MKTVLVIASWVLISGCANQHPVQVQMGVVPHYFTQHIVSVKQTGRYEAEFVSDGKILRGRSNRFVLPVDARVELYLVDCGTAQVQLTDITTNGAVLYHIYVPQVPVAEDFTVPLERKAP